MAAANPERPPSRIEQEVGRLRRMVQQRQFDESATAAAALLREVPENRDVLYLLAVSQRYLGRIADALRTLQQFEALHPDYGRLFQERGHCLRAVGQPLPAIAAYRQAVALNQTLSASWSALQALYTSVGDPVNARLAAANGGKLASRPRAGGSAPH